MSFVLSKYLQNRGGRTHEKKELERGEFVSLDTVMDEVNQSEWYRFGFGEHTLVITKDELQRMNAHASSIERMRGENAAILIER